MKGIKKLFKKDKGFTLVEIIVVLVILAILAAFTIPTMLGFVSDARGKAYIAEAREVYVAAQAVATEYSATTDITDGNNGLAAGSDATSPNYSNATHATGLGVSISSYEVQYRGTDTGTTGMRTSPQWKASRQMYSLLSKDLPISSTLTADLLSATGSRPVNNQASWMVTVGVGPDTLNGSGSNGATRTGKVTKVVYYRNGYQVTIEGNNASVARY